MRIVRRRVAFALLLVGVWVGEPSSAHATPATTLTVFAASSLQEPFGVLARRFEATHPGVQVRLNLAGTPQLAAQLAQGAAADVFASADETWMEDVRGKGLVTGTPEVFARNTLVLLIPRTNPARIRHLRDLARPGVKLAMTLPQVPAGRYTSEALRRLARQPGFPADYERRVRANVVTEEEHVKAVVTKLQLGEVDAGFAYRTDAPVRLARGLTVLPLPLPDSAQVVARYPIAVTRGSRSPGLAQAFMDLVISNEGQSVLMSFGFRPAAADR
jgi:molybdate transport system substrate-binding protein